MSWFSLRFRARARWRCSGDVIAHLEELYVQLPSLIVSMLMLMIVIMIKAVEALRLTVSVPEL